MICRRRVYGLFWENQTWINSGGGGDPPSAQDRAALKLRGFQPMCKKEHFVTWIPGKKCWRQRLSLAGAIWAGLLWAGHARALDPGFDILQYNCRTWGRQNGLPANGISSIAQTKDGYLWLGAAIGLIRFDGTEFEVVDLGLLPEAWRSGIVNGLSSAKDGGLWVGLESSTFGFCDGRNFSYQPRESWSNGFPSVRYVRCVLESKAGALWLGTDEGVLRRWLGADFEEVIGTSSNALNKAPIGNVSDCNEGHAGRIWFGTAENGVYYWQDGKVAKLPDPDLDGESVLAVTEDNEDRIWVGTTGGLRCYDKNFARQDIPPLFTEVRALLVDRHGTMWIGTSGQGLAKYQSGAYSYLRKTNGLAGDFVRSLAEDREGSLWVGAREGLSQLTEVKFPTRPANENPDRKGAVSVGSPAGLTYFDGKPKTYGVEAGLSNLYTKRVLEAANGDVYLVSGTRKLVIFSGQKAVAAYEAPQMVVGMAEDARGVVVSVGGSLYRAGRNDFAPYPFTNGAPSLEWVLGVASGRDGEIWVACNAGVFRVKDGGYRQWGAADGLSDPRAQWVYEDQKGVVWGATMNGMFRLKDNKIMFFTRKNGLFDNNIYSVMPDDFDNLWLDSGRGIFEIRHKSMNDFADGKTGQIECVPYDGPESVKPSDKTSQEHSACKTRDGRIWFPSANGVVEIDPAHVPLNGIPPPVHIDSARANGVDMLRSNSLVVPPGQGELSVHFSALSFIAPHNVKTRYRLEGFDRDWVESNDRRMANYNNLQPGRYTFRVMAANADGVWNERGDAIAIELRPHYYQTAWFDVLCGGLGCAALLGLYSRRVRHLHRKQEALQKTRRLLEAEVQNRTADLAKTNASLQQEIAGRQQTEVQLKQRTLSLEKEIEERKKMQQEVERVHRELLEVSRLAGMSEIATNILHNVGNALNSVNVSATLVAENVKRSKVSDLAKITTLLHEHENDLGTFMTADPKGRYVRPFLDELCKHLLAGQAATMEELKSLRKNIEHIKEIVAMQQDYATRSGVKETLQVHSLVEDSLRMNMQSLDWNGVEVARDFQEVAPIHVEKHKVLQILVNLLSNAKWACDQSGRADKRLTVRVANGDGRLKISVSDNGVGIPAENLNRIFNHGFSTRRNGHGFGLHGSALAAKAMGGTITVRSDGPGQGACFTLELPVTDGGPTS
jgi:ligand-binding sensor domain-containing protein/signal transduction histidine kinase